jgi:hypothetical protein
MNQSTSQASTDHSQLPSAHLQFRFFPLFFERARAIRALIVFVERWGVNDSLVWSFIIRFIRPRAYRPKISYAAGFTPVFYSLTFVFFRRLDDSGQRRSHFLGKKIEKKDTTMTSSEEIQSKFFDYVDQRQALYIERLGEAVAYVRSERLFLTRVCVLLIFSILTPIATHTTPTRHTLYLDGLQYPFYFSRTR